VLVAEDSPTNRQVALGVLDRFGYDADVAEDGAKAVEKVRAKDYDLVLMDVQMPEMAGFDATRRIREDLDDGEQPRIVGLSVHVDEEARREGREAGMDAHVEKPISADVVNEMLSETADERA